MKFWELSLDSIAHILDYVDGHDLGNLYKCGFAEFWNRVAAGGSTRFSLELTSRAKVVFPDLKDLLPRIRSLHVKEKRDIAVPNFDWKLLPSNLVHLSILCPALAISLDGVHLPLVEKLHLGRIVPASQQASALPDLTRIAPRLADFLVSMPKDHLFLDKLPPRLTKLTVRCISVVYGSSEDGYAESSEASEHGWPQELVDLELEVAALALARPDLARLPPSLTRLSLGTPARKKEARDLDWQFHHLPNLLTLHVGVMRGLKSHRLNGLPPTVTHLSVAQFSFPTEVTFHRALPRSLTHLGASPTCNLGVLSLEHAQALPRNLKSGVRLWIEDPALYEHLPPGAQNILMRSGLHPICTTLSACQSLSVFNHSSLEFLPPNVTDLSLDQPISASDLALLPRSLQALDCMHWKPDVDASLHLLPPGLRTLEISNNFTFRHSSLATLPRTLTRFIAISATNIQNPDWFAGAPPNLLQLSLEELRGISKPSWLEPLRASASLVSLYLGFRRLPGPFREFIPYLPRRLQHLTLSLDYLFGDDEFDDSDDDDDDAVEQSRDKDTPANDGKTLKKVKKKLTSTLKKPPPNEFQKSDIALLPRSLLTFRCNPAPVMTLELLAEAPPYLTWM